MRYTFRMNKVMTEGESVYILMKYRSKKLNCVAPCVSKGEDRRLPPAMLHRNTKSVPGFNLGRLSQ